MRFPRLGYFVAARPVGTRTNRLVTPASVAPIVYRVHPALICKNQVVGVSETWGVHLHRSSRDQLGLIQAVVTAKRIIAVDNARASLVIESG